MLDVDGQIDLRTVDTLGSAVDEELTPPTPSALVLKLSAVTFCSCVGLTILLQTAERAAQAAIPLRLVCPHRAVLRPREGSERRQGLGSACRLPLPSDTGVGPVAAFLMRSPETVLLVAHDRTVNRAAAVGMALSLLNQGSMFFGGAEMVKTSRRVLPAIAQ